MSSEAPLDGITVLDMSRILAGPTATTMHQGFCVYAVLKPQYARGFNFISWDTNNNVADGLHETCHEPSGAQTTTCTDAFGRRFELYIR